jgi:hypothetical protein
VKLAAHQLINQTSGKVEYYTPSEIITAAKLVMGGIDLDPFSSAIANKRVKAHTYFTAKQNAYYREWHGRIWMNHPFGKEHNARAIDKLMREYHYQRLREACCITFACTSERWFQPLMHFPQCFLCPRTNYVLPNGETLKGVTKGSVVTYLGKNVTAFRKAFKPFGVVK